MRFLIVINETGGTSIQDKYEFDNVDQKDLNISKDLRLKMRTW